MHPIACSGGSEGAGGEGTTFDIDDTQVSDTRQAQDAAATDSGDTDAAVPDANDATGDAETGVPDSADAAQDTATDVPETTRDAAADWADVEADSPSNEDVADGETGHSAPIAALTYLEHTLAAGISGVQWEPAASAADDLCGEVSLLTGGAAVEDYDGDGDLDVFIPRLGLPAQLWTNDGDGTFIDLAAEFGIADAELSNGAAWFDADGDGTFELFVSQVMGLNRLWQQRESGAWVDVAEEFGLSGSDVNDEDPCQRVFGFQMGHVSDDALLDIVLVRWGARFSGGATQILFGMNGGGWRAQLDTGFIRDGLTRAFTAHIFDFVGDSRNDIYLTGDFERSRAYQNRDGLLVDITDGYGLGTEENGMGTAIGDINNDGHLDLFVTSIYGDPEVDYCNGAWGCSGNRLYLGTGDGFEDATDEYGVREGGWGWGAVMFDADIDGDTDLAMVNGYNLLWDDAALDVYRERTSIYNTDTSHLWLNNGGAPLTDVGVEAHFVSDANERAIIPFDMDRDGDLDILVIRNAGEPRLLRAETDERVSGVSVRFRGRADHGVNAVVTIVAGPESTSMVGHLRPFGLQSSSRAHEVHFGLGEGEPEQFSEVSVVFGDGATARWTNVTFAPLIVLDLAEAEAVTP